MQGRVAFATLTDATGNLTLQLEGKLIEPYIVMRLIVLPDTARVFSIGEPGLIATEPHSS